MLVKDDVFDKVKVLKNSCENFYWFSFLNFLIFYSVLYTFRKGVVATITLTFF